ncbi:hypothetical protein GCM10007205_27620 [Oxalicibacterium flavum]|uniref:N-acetyltransferase domain-containing protein n=1 Tax=Oxalicibacterium flavum TaxID=179467 RepID=A0A8J2UMA5_9BURK|nr:GNAT family N-acetyltransferase [Oxalicibacterium flavum]GGC17112.1 hypothetical protein GCM10007205_27620 [Oxalicibacterium flavum]
MNQSSFSSSGNCVVERAQGDASTIIAEMLHPYLRELGTSEPYPYLPLYWQEKERHPFLIKDGIKVIGFVLVRALDEHHIFELAEFYIFPKERGKGYGRSAVQQLFSLFQGRWKLTILAGNSAALGFWRKVMPLFSEEITDKEDGSQTFTFQVDFGQNE